MPDPTPIPAEALYAAFDVFHARHGACLTPSAEKSLVEAVVIAVAPILLAAGRTAAAEDIRAYAADQERAAKERASVGEVRRQVGAVVNAYRAAARVAENGANQ